MNTTMNKNRQKFVSIERAIALIDCYGANIEAWPDEERVAAIALVKASTQLQQRLQAAQQLDDALNGYGGSAQTHQPALVSRIIDQLPDQDPAELITAAPDPINQRSVLKSDETYNPTYLKVESHFWQKKSMIAAGFALFFVAYFLSQSQTSSLKPTTLIAQPILDQWMLDEIAADNTVNNSNNENDDDEELTFMAMVELEI